MLLFILHLWIQNIIHNSFFHFPGHGETFFSKFLCIQNIEIPSKKFIRGGKLCCFFLFFFTLFHSFFWFLLLLLVNQTHFPLNHLGIIWHWCRSLLFYNLLFGNLNKIPGKWDYLSCEFSELAFLKAKLFTVFPQFSKNQNHFYFLRTEYKCFCNKTQVQGCDIIYRINYPS